MGRGSTVQANSVLKVIAAARQAGLDVPALLAPHGLTEDQLAVPGARVPFAALVALYEDSARASGDEAFGLRVGAQTHPAMFDVLGHATMSCDTLEAAFATITRYLRVLQEGAVVTLARDGEVARATYAIVDPDVGPHRHEVEATLAIMFQFLDTTLGGTFQPRHVRFVHAAPADPALHRTIFRAPVEFGRAANEVAFDGALLAQPMPRADPALRAILERHIVEVLAKLPPRSDLVGSVRGCVARLLEQGEPPIGAVAKSLAMSGRTLQRRLQEHDTSFAEILDEVRKQLAVRYLADDRRETADVAFLLGYSELSTFHRAFRRWTGMAPGEWRRQSSTEATR